MGGLISSLFTCNWTIGGDKKEDKLDKILERMENKSNRDVEFEDKINRLTNKVGYMEIDIKNQIKRIEDKIDVKMELINMKFESLLKG